MSYLLQLQTSLDTKLSQISGSFDVAWENMDYNPTKGQGFLRPTLILTESNFAALDGSQENNGIYRVDVFVPLGEGPRQALLKIDEIYDHFKSDLLLLDDINKIYIKTINRSSPALIEEAWYMVSLDINFTCYSNN